MKDAYESPLSSRYASEYMQKLFSADMRYTTWRRLWVSLAKAESRLGLPITEEQTAELEAHVNDIDYAVVAEREKTLDEQLRFDEFGDSVAVFGEVEVPRPAGDPVDAERNAEVRGRPVP